MPMTPSSAPATLRPDIAEMVEYDIVANAGGYIADLVSRPVNVALQSDNPGKIPLEQLLRNKDGTSTLRMENGDYPRGNWKFETFGYNTEENGWEERIDDRSAARYQHIIGGADLIAGQLARDMVMGNREKRVADQVFNATTFASYTTGITNEWDDVANAVPITDVAAAKQSIFTQSGLDANALIINKTVYENLLRCDQIQDVIASQGAGRSYALGELNAAALSLVFDLKHIIVAGGANNSAKAGQAAVPARMWSNEYAMVCRIAEGDNPREPTAFRTFHWTEDGSQLGGAFEEYYDDRTRGRIMRARMDTDEVVMYAAAGHLLSNVTT